MAEAGPAAGLPGRRADPRDLSSGAALLAIVACTMLTAALVRPVRDPAFIWNSSGSMPIGLYLVDREARIARGDVVAARLPPMAEAFAASRGYLPPGLPIIKHVAGLPGDRICSDGRKVTVNGAVAAARLPADAKGRPLPLWQGCEILAAADYLLLGEGKRSFDGRYFGVSREEARVAKARLLWRR